MTWYKSILYFLAVGFLCSCSIGKSNLKESSLQSEKIFPYDLTEAGIHELAPELKEISGLCYNATSSQMAAVQDEDGVVYTLDKVNGSILSRDTFYKAGDYEGLAVTDDYIFVLKSSGTVYQVDKKDIAAKPIKIKSFLTKELDVEGIEYDRAGHSLLLCCKNYTTEDTKNQRFIYRYDLLKKHMLEEPYLTIDRTEILTYLKENFSTEYIKDKFKKISNPDLDYLHLGPSAIAVHPITRNIYILSSQSKVLLIYSGRSKELSHVQKLDKAIFEQPEGICFDDRGSMFISSEGKKAAARFIIFPMQKSKVRTER